MNFSKLFKETLLRVYGKLHKLTYMLYSYDENKYNLRFLTPKKEFIAPDKAEEVVYIFWTGRNEMTPNRLKNLIYTKEHIGVKVKFITPDNLDEYILSSSPLHPAYEYLSVNHKSDYLRCYFMHHYGGGYTDLKKINHSWEEAFKKINSDPNKIAIGYDEFYFGTARITNDTHHKGIDNLNRDLKIHYGYLLGNGAFIIKPNSDFTKDWFNEVNKRLDDNYENLKKNPGIMFGDNEGYPLEWTYMQGQIFHPLCLKYHKHLLKDNSLKPEFKNYR